MRFKIQRTHFKHLFNVLQNHKCRACSLKPDYEGNVVLFLLFPTNSLKMSNLWSFKNSTMNILMPFTNVHQLLPLCYICFIFPFALSPREKKNHALT